jgi:hypothetical protein
MDWPLACSIELGALEVGAVLALFAVVADASGAEIHRQGFVVERGGDVGVVLRHSLLALRFPAATAGVWAISIVTGTIELARLPIEIRIRSR